MFFLWLLLIVHGSGLMAEAGTRPGAAPSGAEAPGVGATPPGTGPAPGPASAMIHEPKNGAYRGPIEAPMGENHKKIIGKIAIIIMAIFGHFMVKLYLSNRFNILIGFVRFGLV